MVLHCSVLQPATAVQSRLSPVINSGIIQCIIQGSSHMVYGSTVISMAHHLAVEVGNMAPMLAVRGVSSAVGNLLGGVCIDRLHKISFWLLTLVIFIETVGEKHFFVLGSYYVNVAGYNDTCIM